MTSKNPKHANESRTRVAVYTRKQQSAELESFEAQSLACGLYADRLGAIVHFPKLDLSQLD